MNIKQKVGVVIPARNEQHNLKYTLDALMIQSVKPYQVIVVNDGSTDKTVEIAKQHGCDVIDFPEAHDNWVTLPDLAKVKNLGFDLLHRDLDYMMILGADHILPPDYIERVIERMEKDPKLVVASGSIQKEWSIIPRGSGRIVKNSFWLLIGARYPVNWGYESWMISKANQLGYTVAHFDDIVTTVLRKTAMTYKPIMYYHYGKAMKALGSQWFYVLGRSLIIIKRAGLASGWQFNKGYIQNKTDFYDDELRAFVKSKQQFSFKHIKNLINYLRY